MDSSCDVAVLNHTAHFYCIYYYCFQTAILDTKFTKITSEDILFSRFKAKLTVNIN